MLFVLANSMVAMDAPHSLKSLLAKTRDIQSEIIAQSSQSSTPKTLFQHFGIPSNTVSDIQKLLVAHIVGPGGWYYKHLKLRHPDGIRDIAFNAEGTQIATASGTEARVWSTQNGNCLSIFDHDDTNVERVLFHQENKAVITLASDASGYSWSLDGKLKPDRFTFDERFVPYGGYNLRTHLRGPMLIRTLQDAQRSICLGNMNNRCVASYSPHVGSVTDVQFHRQEDVLVACDSEAVVLWCLQTKKKLCSIAHDGTSVTNIKFHRKEKLFAIATFGDVSIRDFNGILFGKYTFAQPWTVQDGIVFDRPTFSESWSAVSVMLNPQLKRLVIIKGRDTSAILWNFENEGEGQAQELMHAYGPLVAAFNPQGTILAIAGDIERDCKIYLRNSDGDLVRTIYQGGSMSPSLCYAKGNVFATRAYAGGRTHSVDVYIWQKHENPTLQQVLLRLVLQQYYKACIKKKEKPEICATYNLIPQWMAQKFALKKDELVSVWHSMPETLRKSIFNTLLFRAKSIEAGITVPNKFTDCTIS